MGIGNHASTAAWKKSARSIRAAWGEQKSVSRVSQIPGEWYLKRT